MIAACRSPPWRSCCAARQPRSCHGRRRRALGRDSLEAGQWQQSARQIVATCQLLHALRDNVDVLGGDPLAANLAELYDYAGHRVGVAASEACTAPLDEVWHLLMEVRAAWFALPAAARMKTGRPASTPVQTWSPGPCSMVPTQ
jgi:flagellin-specific chaperone FliS